MMSSSLRSLIFLIVVFAGVLNVSFSHADALDVRPTLTLGSGVMFERGNDNRSESARLPLSLAAGARLESWGARFEYASFRTSDGNQTVSVARAVENILAWGTYDFGRDLSWTPYVGVGLGMGRTVVETTVNQTRETSKGDWQGVWAAAAGVRGFWTSRFAVRPEIRIESAEALKTKDARLGVFVQLDFVF